MPPSPRRIPRKGVIVQPPVIYELSPRRKIDRATSDRSHNSKNLSSKNRSVSRTESSGSPRRPYKYRRIRSGSPQKSFDRSRKLAFCLGASILIVLVLIASGLYIYYFVDGDNEKKVNEVIVYAPTLVPTKATTTISLIETENITESYRKIGNETRMNETLENEMKNETFAVKSVNAESEDAVDEAFYYSEKICIENEKNRECVAGSAAEEAICSRGGTCTHVQYHANAEPNGEIFDPEVELRHLDLTSWPAPNGTLCQRPNRGLGVCFGGQCLRRYNGTRRFDQIEGQWKDNCDQPNPCWTTPNQVPIENRTFCTTTPKDCNKDFQCENGATVAVVWLEHRYCSLNPARAGRYCKGLPFRLWLCRFCRGRNFPASEGLKLSQAYAMDFCLQKYSAMPKKSFGECLVECHDFFSNETAGTVVMPNGSVCMADLSKNHAGYCYNGRCFRAEASLYEEKLKTVEECEKEKKIDLEKWTL